MWRVLLNDQYELAAKVRLVCDHAFVLGLRNPSEPTYQKMAALLLVAHHGPMGARALSQQVLQDVLGQAKDQWKKNRKTREQLEERARETGNPAAARISGLYVASKGTSRRCN